MNRPAPAAGAAAGTAAGRLEANALAALTRRSDRRGLAQLAGHLALLTAAGTAVAALAGSPLRWPALLLYGIPLVLLFAPLHETVHYTAFRSRWLNTLVAGATGFLLLLPPRYFRAFHLAHHRYTQQPGRDPELAGGPRNADWPRYLWHVSGLPLWRACVTTLLRHAAGRVDEPFVAGDRKTASALIAEARLFVAGYLLLAALSLWFASAWLWQYWLLPMLLAQPLLRLFLLAEHTGCHRGADMLRNSRTTHTNALLRFLAWNMPYHAEHHAYAAVPFHRLPALHRLLRDRIAFQRPGYWRVSRELAPPITISSPSPSR